MEHCLVTGGAGFIGSNLVERLLSSGCTVRILDDLSTGKQENIAHLEDKIDFIRGDLRNRSDVESSLQGIDSIFHLGAIPSVNRSVKNPVDSVSVNIYGTTILLDAAEKNNINRVVFASSSSVYGDTAVLPKKETMMPCPLSPYALSKLTGEMLCENFFRLKGLETVSLRFFNVFGRNQDPESEYAAVVPKFITALIQGEKPVVYGDGLQSRDFTPVENVVEALIDAMEASSAAGKVFNVGCSRSFSLIQLLDALGDILHVVPDPVFLEPRPGDVKHSLADIESAREVLGYDPAVTFRDGLEQTVRWFKGGCNG